jgi:uncharacterized protein
MLYRTLAGEKVSQLGFGAMRLPTTGGKIDLPATTSMIRSAIDGGLNYVDTAYVYHGGESESAVGRVLRDGWRNKVLVATKSPVWLLQKAADFSKFLEEQLKRLETDHIDFYLLHSLNAETWAKCQQFGALDFLEKAKAAGKIRHFGFSFHDEAPCFQAILSAFPWEFCQLQYNFMDRNYQAGTAGLEAAVAQGTSVVVMEPLRGGNLANAVPPAVQALYDEAPVRRTPAEWALRWVWNNPGVAIALSGMGAQAQVDENLKIAGTATAGSLTRDELVMMDRAEVTYRNLVKVGCTGCRYCMPCPQDVDIPRNFAMYNEYAMFMESPAVKAGYQWVPESARANRCVACGACVDLCPQQIDIPAVMRQVAVAFG